MRHCRTSLLSDLETFTNLGDLSALQMSKFNSDCLKSCSDRCTCPQVFGVAIASNHLRGRNWLQTKCCGNGSFNRWINVGVGANCARQFAHRNSNTCSAHALMIAVYLQCPQRDLCPECGWLGVNAVRSANHCRIAMLLCQCNKNCPQLFLCTNN